MGWLTGKNSKPESNKTQDFSANMRPQTGSLSNNVMGLPVPQVPEFNMPDFSKMWADFNISDFLPDMNISQWFNDLISGIEMPDFSQMWADFNVTEFLPELNISEWLTESMSSFEMPDLSTLLPDMSSIGTMLSESFAGIPEMIGNIALSVGEGFSQIPIAADEAFSTISSVASEGLASIQAEWSQLPSFFAGLWAGAAGAASAAGAAIASGINSAIGMIQSAWEGLSGWLSSKISSLASMASSAASSIMGAISGGGGIGHNATGTASWRGGFTEINEQGGEIIDLPSGTRIYPHATTMKMLQQDMANGKLDGLGGYSSEDIDIAGDMFSMGAFENPSTGLSTFPQSLDLSAFPQAPQVNDLTGVQSMLNTSNSTTNTNNNGVTISGNTFNVRTDSDIDKIAFKLFEMMSDANANYAGA